MKILFKSNSPNGHHDLKQRTAKEDEFWHIICGKTKVKQWATIGECPVFCSEKDYWGWPDMRGIKL